MRQVFTPPLPLAQPKTTDKRFFFLNGCRLTTPQAKVKKAEKEKKDNDAALSMLCCRAALPVR